MARLISIRIFAAFYFNWRLELNICVSTTTILINIATSQHIHNKYKIIKVLYIYINIIGFSLYIIHN